MATHFDYYNIIPEEAHRTGDIWTGLPTFGMLGKQTLPGIVITPACDLAAQKVETVTYLPILSVEEYLYTYPLTIRIQEAIVSCQNALQLEKKITLERTKDLPKIEEINSVIGAIIDFESTGKRSAKDLEKANQYKCALSVLIKIIGATFDVDKTELKSCHGSNFEKHIYNIITNNYSVDIHFLPSDGQRIEWAGISKHSVALFRYPLTAPVSIFNLAQKDNTNWTEKMNTIKTETPIATNFIHETPVKKSTLKQHFMSDLISRYVALYVRIGSPDFPKTYVERCKAEVLE